MSMNNADYWQELTATFTAQFGGQARVRVQAPGRVNLIGEHTDYNGGFVLPSAIDRYIRLLARPTPANVLLYAQDKRQSDSFRGLPEQIANWADYPRGVLAQLREAGYQFGGVEIAFGGDLPAGAGLSSSAAVEVAVAAAVRAIYDLPISDEQLALLCQRAENQFVGVASGIMDQFAVTLSRADHALLLDCRSLKYQHVPLLLGDNYRLVIVESGQKRSLLTAPYNQRRAECEAAVAALQLRLPDRQITSLRDVTAADLSLIDDATALKRARHIVSENARVQQAAALLVAGDLRGFGRLMNEAHQSMSHDFEASTPEIDALVAAVQNVPGVLGARITGAGWGGCTVNLVANSALAAFEQAVDRFREQSKLPSSTFVCRAVDGVVVSLPPPAPLGRQQLAAALPVVPPA